MGGDGGEVMKGKITIQELRDAYKRIKKERRGTDGEYWTETLKDFYGTKRYRDKVNKL